MSDDGNYIPRKIYKVRLRQEIYYFVNQQACQENGAWLTPIEPFAFLEGMVTRIT